MWGYEMRKMVAGILRQYGTSMILSHGETTKKVRGFFQPVRSKSWQNFTNVATPLGEIPRGQYVYIGPAEKLVAFGDTLEVGGRDYMVRRVEPVYYGEKIAYYWGMCVEKGGEDTWGQS